MLFVDFNRFKQINDQFGHDVGDKVLKELSMRLADSVHSEDMVARYAGDEFVICWSRKAKQDIEKVRTDIENKL